MRLSHVRKQGFKCFSNSVNNNTANSILIEFFCLDSNLIALYLKFIATKQEE